MSDRRDQDDDPVESELRSWFLSRRTPAAPSTLRAFADQVGSGAKPTAPVRRLTFGWRQAPGGRLAAAATSIAIAVLAGGLLLVAGQRGPAAPTSSPVTSQPAVTSGTASPSSPPSPPSSSLPSSGGTCSADQLIVGRATSGFTFSVVSYRHAIFTQVVRNAGGDCVLAVPKVIGAATASGPLVAVGVNNTGNEVCVNRACHYVTPATYMIRSGQTFEIEFSVSWFVGANDANGTPLSTAPPCAGEVTDVARVAFPVASGAIAIDLEAASPEAGASVPWHQVCSSPMSISFEIKP